MYLLSIRQCNSQAEIISCENQKFGLLGKINAYLDCVYKKDEKAFSDKYSELKKAAYAQLTEAMRQKVITKAQKLGIANPQDLI